MKTTVALVALVTLVGLAEAQLFPLRVIHFNDLHARYNQVNLEGFTCLGQDLCQGGYPRQVSVVRQLQEEAENSVYVNAGGNFKGTLWYTVHRWEVVAAMLNVLPADAMTLGRFDFFHGLEGLNPFMEASETPILLTNVDNSADPSFVNFERSVVVERSGRRIGLLGVIRPDVAAVGRPGNLTFTDPIEAVREESARLAEDGVDIIIVLSYWGYEDDRRMARMAGPHIDLIVGGSSNTVLFSGDRDSFPLDVEGNYPRVEFQQSGRQVLVVQAGSYGRLVGNLTVFFDEDGEVEQWEGNPVFLDSDVVEDSATMTALAPFREEVETRGNRTVAVAEVDMSRQDCIRGECAIGSLIADSMVRAFFPVFNGIALHNRGGIRGDLQAGTITYKQLFEVLPFENELYSLLLRGDQLIAVLENGVRRAQMNNGTVRALSLLQVSGLRVTYRLGNPPGRRVDSVDVLCQQCTGEVYEPINLFREYRVVVTSFLAEGGDGFSTFANYGMDPQVGPVDLDAFEEYVESLSPLSDVGGGRIRFAF